jgi:hypothetical protein
MCAAVAAARTEALVSGEQLDVARRCSMSQKRWLQSFVAPDMSAVAAAEHRDVHRNLQVSITVLLSRPVQPAMACAGMQEGVVREEC